MDTPSINFDQLDECKQLIKDLKKHLHGVEAIERDPANYISEQFYELKRQVDLRRENILLEINKRSDALIKEIDLEHRKCLASFNLRASSTINVSSFKDELEVLNNVSDQALMNYVKQCEDCFSKSNELKVNLDLMVEQYTAELMGNQAFKITPEIRIDEAFGSLDIKQVRSVNNL